MCSPFPLSDDFTACTETKVKSCCSGDLIFHLEHIPLQASVWAPLSRCVFCYMAAIGELSFLKSKLPMTAALSQGSSLEQE